MKKYLLLLTALCFCAFANKALAQSWSLNDGTLVISSDDAFSSFPYPWDSNINEIKTLVINPLVTSIPSNAFRGYTNLTNVTIEDGSGILDFNSVCNDQTTFYDSSIRSLYLGRNIIYSTGCGVSPFSGNTLLTTLTIGNNVTSINDYCFNGCLNLTTLTIKDGSKLTSIGNYAFNSCTSMSSPLNIPVGVKTIGYSAFYECKQMPSLDIPNSVISIGSIAFSGCMNLIRVTIEDGTGILDFGSTCNDQTTFYGSSIENLYLGRSISYSTGCGVSPFSDNLFLSTLTIGNNVTSINDYCFTGCTNLTMLTIKDGSKMTSIGNYAFNGCSSMSSLLNIPVGVKTIGSSAFYECKQMPSLDIPNSVMSIGTHAFSSCTSLTRVTIEDGSNTLNFGSICLGNDITFYGSSIESLYLGRNISYSTGCGVSPFSDNLFLTTLTIGSNVTSIGDYVFSGCSGLTSITIPSGVTSIGSQAFYRCNGLKEIHSQKPTPPNAVDGCFFDVYKTCKLYVPTLTSVDLYKEAPEWEKFFTITGIANILSNQLKIFPNPVKDDLFIKSNLQIKKVEIYSLTGNLLLLENNFNGKISVSALPDGVYLLKVYTGKGMAVSKIVKE